MNNLAAFALDLLLTIVLALLLVVYLSPSLFRILVDLCGTDERARFWLTFSRILLLGIPTVTALGFQPGVNTIEPWYLDVAHELGRNAMALLASVIGLGFVITFFAAVAPRPTREKAS